LKNIIHFLQNTLFKKGDILNITPYKKKMNKQPKFSYIRTLMYSTLLTSIMSNVSTASASSMMNLQHQPYAPNIHPKPVPPPEVPKEYMMPPQQVLFSHAGLYAGQTHMIHYRIPIPMAPILEDMTNFQDNLTKHHNNTKDGISTIIAETQRGKDDYVLQTVDSKEIKHVIVNAYNEVEVIKYEFYQLLKTLPSSTQGVNVMTPNDHPTSTLEGRPKRQIVEWVALGEATAALSLATVNRIELDKMKGAITEFGQKTDLIVDVQKIHDKHLHLLQAQVDSLLDQMAVAENSLNAIILNTNLRTKIESYRRKLNIIKDFIKAAMMNKLSPGILPAETVFAMMNHTTETANKLGYRSFIKEPSDLFQLPTSFQFNSTSLEFVVYVHVPLVSPANLMTLYQYVPAPILISPASPYSLTPELDNNNLIAYNEDDTFKVVSLNELNACINLGNAYFCKGRSIINRNLDTTCLGALFSGHITEAQENCRFRITKRQENVFQTDINTFRIFPRLNSVEGKLKCNDTNTKIMFVNGDEIKLSKGCRLTLEHHIVTAGEEEEMTMTSPVASLAWNPKDMFPHHDLQQVDLAISHLKEMGAHNLDASDLINQLEKMKSATILGNLNSGSSWIWLAAVIAGGIAIIIITCWCKKHKNAKRMKKFNTIPTNQIDIHIDPSRNDSNAPIELPTYRTN
jgi:hypothetical protein